MATTPNVLTPIMHKILARGLMALREQVVMPRLVNNDYSNDAAIKGDSVQVPIPVTQTAASVTPAETPKAPADKAPTTVTILLDQWFQSDFHLNDKELTEIDRNEHFVPMQLSEAVRALANEVNQQIWAQYTGIWGYVGVAGTTPFTGGVDDAVQLRKELNIQVCPRDSRRAILDYVAEAEALKQAPFRDASASTDSGVIIEGNIGRKYGFNWYADDHVPSHTAGEVFGEADVIAIDESDAALRAIGVKTMTVDVDAGTSDFVIGDIFTIAGNTQKYVTTNAGTLTTAGIAMNFEPALVQQHSDSDVITFPLDDHVVNLGFHRDAFAFATRPLAVATADLELGSRFASMQDPVSGIVLRLEVSRQYKQTMWDLDILWGSKLVRADLAVRLLG